MTVLGGWGFYRQPERNASGQRSWRHGIATSEKNRPAHGCARGVRFLIVQREGLDLLYVDGLGALGAFGHFERDRLALIEGLEAFGDDVVMMDENIVAFICRDETVTLGIVKPFHLTCWHAGEIGFTAPCFYLTVKPTESMTFPP